MKEIIKKLIKKEEITDKEIANELFEICDNVHATCDDSCPIYELTKNGEYDFGYGKSDCGCTCFKNGTEMLRLLRTHSNLD